MIFEQLALAWKQSLPWIFQAGGRPPPRLVRNCLPLLSVTFCCIICQDVCVRQSHVPKHLLPYFNL